MTVTQLSPFVYGVYITGISPTHLEHQCRFFFFFNLYIHTQSCKVHYIFVVSQSFPQCIYWENYVMCLIDRDRYSMHLSEPWWPYKLGLWLGPLMVRNLTVSVASEDALRFSKNLRDTQVILGQITKWLESSCWRAALGSVVVLGDSSVPSTALWRAWCLVRVFWMPVWAITISSALGGQALGLHTWHEGK